MAAAFHTTDVGQEISKRWGAKRIEGRPAEPARKLPGAVPRCWCRTASTSRSRPRNAISCRCVPATPSPPPFPLPLPTARPPHRPAPTPISRQEAAPRVVHGRVHAGARQGRRAHRSGKGFMVGLQQRPPLLQAAAARTPSRGSTTCAPKDVDFYTIAGHSSQSYENLEREIAALKAAGREHSPRVASRRQRRGLLPDRGAGRRLVRRDALRRRVHRHAPRLPEHGAATTSAGAKTMLAVAGCSGRAFGWADALLRRHRRDGRRLRERTWASPRSACSSRACCRRRPSSEGQTLQRLTCSNPFDCQNKCEALERRSRGGAASPRARGVLAVQPAVPRQPGHLVRVDRAQPSWTTWRARCSSRPSASTPAACVCQIMMMVRKRKPSPAPSSLPPPPPPPPLHPPESRQGAPLHATGQRGAFGRADPPGVGSTSPTTRSPSARWATSW